MKLPTYRSDMGLPARSAKHGAIRERVFPFRRLLSEADSPDAAAQIYRGVEEYVSSWSV